MAERSFVREVEMLRVPAGTEFRGEGILAVTKALMEAGVAYVSGYQGSPISHLMDVLADAQPILEELGVYFQPAASEAAAAAMLSASVMYSVRGAVAWKSTVGTNVASDALANLASGGVTGGALIVVGEDYGEGSSIMQERTHGFAMKSQIWLLDPRPNLPAIVQAVHDGFELSEVSHTPVMLQLRIRSCHLHGSFVTRENRRPAFTLRQALEAPRRDVNRIVLPPASFLHEHEKIEQRWPAAVDFIRQRKLNEFFDGDLAELGIVVLGGLYNNVLRALLLHGMADLYGESRIPLYVLNVAYPLVDDEVVRFCAVRSCVGPGTAAPRRRAAPLAPRQFAARAGDRAHRGLAARRTRRTGARLRPRCRGRRVPPRCQGLQRFPSARQLPLRPPYARRRPPGGRSCGRPGACGAARRHRPSPGRPLTRPRPAGASVNRDR